MERIILHADLNAFYASVELLYHPELRGKPVAVGGDAEKRHGIILAKSEEAKKAGVKTGMALWQAKSQCPNIIIQKPNLAMYGDFAKAVREIYSDYTDKEEPYGIDESWLDLTGYECSKAGGESAAQDIRQRIKKELGLTVSIGVSWNKLYAKLGSDLKKPDAVTTITMDNYRDVVWPLTAEELLYVGSATQKALRSMGIRTIGELANTDPKALHHRFGKIGYVLSAYANGLDYSEVSYTDSFQPVKSIGHSTTTPFDLTTDSDVWLTLMTLAESVGMRLRENGFKSRLVSVGLRTTDLSWKGHQRKLKRATDITREILDIAFKIYQEIKILPLRSVGLRTAELVPFDIPEQLDIFEDFAAREKQRTIDAVTDDIRRRFGYKGISRGSTYLDDGLGSLEPLNFLTALYGINN